MSSWQSWDLNLLGPVTDSAVLTVLLYCSRHPIERLWMNFCPEFPGWSLKIPPMAVCFVVPHLRRWVVVQNTCTVPTHMPSWSFCGSCAQGSCCLPYMIWHWGSLFLERNFFFFFLVWDPDVICVLHFSSHAMTSLKIKSQKKMSKNIARKKALLSE